MAESKWTDEALIAAIKSGGTAQNAAVKHLYFARNYRNPVFKIVLDGAAPFFPVEMGGKRPHPRIGRVGALAFF